MELHFGTGGSDSKDFVDELFTAYCRYAAKNNLCTEILDNESFGHVVAKISGNNAGFLFKNESGQHVVQRIPHNSRGKKQTSIISVAVLPLPPENKIKILPESEFDIKYQTGGGPGGQAVNNTANAARVRHIKTGLITLIQTQRSQSQNKKLAIHILSAKVNEIMLNKQQSAYAANRNLISGNGNRGEKMRTYNFLNSFVKDHKLGTKTGNIEGVMNGRLELINQLK